MENERLNIYAIVVTYKGMRWYDRCFTSLRNSTIPVQTIVVDNASGDGTVEYIKENYPEIILIESKENLGFGKGNNLAMKYAYEHDCDYVFLLNQDAWLDENDSLERLVDVAQKHPDYGILSPMHMFADKHGLNMMLEYGCNVYTAKLLSDLYCDAVKDVYDTNYVNAAAWLLPRMTLSVIGGFTPLIFHYGEDDDYLNRARYHKIKIGIVPSAKIIHDHNPGETSEYSQKLSRQALSDNVAELLDINKSFDYHRLRRYLLRKYVVSVFSGNVKNRSYFLNRLKYVRHMRRSVECSRKVNEIPRPNWIG